jgi:hypothetical protein
MLEGLRLEILDFGLVVSVGEDLAIFLGVWLDVGEIERFLFFPLPPFGGEGMAGFHRKSLTESACFGKWGGDGAMFKCDYSFIVHIMTIDHVVPLSIFQDIYQSQDERKDSVFNL